MKVDLKFVQDNLALYRQFGVGALNPAVIEALFVVAELSLGLPGDEVTIEEDAPAEAPAEKPARKPRSKVA